MTTRAYAYAGGFYPGSKSELARMLDGFFARIKVQRTGRIRALIVPHAGYIYSGIVAAASYSLLKGSGFKRVVILGPSHRVDINSPCADSNDKWASPLGDVGVDKEAVKKLGVGVFAEAHAREHSIEVQIPFLQRVLGKFLIVPVLLNYYDEQFMGMLKGIIDDETIIIASSDLSHYLPYDEAVAVDRKTLDAVKRRDIVGFEKNASACGSASIATLIRLARELKWKARVIDYKNSGDTAGDKMAVVGYASIVFTG